jgi:hypothetical protein
MEGMEVYQTAVVFVIVAVEAFLLLRQTKVTR